jgi:hypothetical protein
LESNGTAANSKIRIPSLISNFWSGWNQFSGTIYWLSFN